MLSRAVTLIELINCGKYAEVVKYVIAMELFDCRFTSELFTFVRMATKWDGELNYHQALFTFKFMETTYEVIGNYTMFSKNGHPQVYWSTLRKTKTGIAA